jgi:hypothetical protein
MPKFYEEIGAEDDNLIHDSGSGLLGTSHKLSRASFILAIVIAFLVFLVLLFTAGSYFSAMARFKEDGECTASVAYTAFTQANYNPTTAKRSPPNQFHADASVHAGPRLNEFPVPPGAARFSVPPGSLLMKVCRGFFFVFFFYIVVVVVVVVVVVLVVVVVVVVVVLVVVVVAAAAVVVVVIVIVFVVVVFMPISSLSRT